LTQRYGLRVLNLEGFESSSNRFVANQVIDVENPNFAYSNDDKSPEVFFSGNDLKTDKMNVKVGGTIESHSKVSSVMADGRLCVFNDYSFVCDVDLKAGENVINVVVQDSSGRKGDNSFTIRRVVSSLSVDIKDVYGNNIVNANGEKYLTSGEFNIGGVVNDYSVLGVLIDGREILEQDMKGDFVLDVDANDDLRGVEKKDVVVQLKAQDEFGHVAFSDKVVLIYERVFETFAKILVR